MTRSTLTTTLLLALLTTSCLAQDSKRKDEPKTLAQESKPQAEPNSEARAEFDQLKARFDADFEGYIAKHADLLRHGKREEADQHRRENRPAEKFVGEFFAGAKKYQGSPAAAPFLGWLVSSSQSNKELGEQAVKILLADHLMNLEIRSLLSIAGVRRMTLAYGRDGMRERLALFVEKSPHDEVRTPARYILAQGNLRDPKISAEARQAALDELRSIGAESEGTLLAKQARAVVFEAEHLQLGMEAPEIIGEDLEGRSMRLTDFRGQIVLLEFWADSQVACRATYKHNKSMYEKFAITGRYAHFGVNCDDDQGYAKHRAHAAELYWRSIWNGPDGLAGGIAQLWNVSSMPTFYVIDEKGIIRHKTLRGLVLERSIEDLLVQLGALDKD